mgnify:CR=1 FL=1
MKKAGSYQSSVKPHGNEPLRPAGRPCKDFHPFGFHAFLSDHVNDFGASPVLEVSFHAQSKIPPGRGKAKALSGVFSSSCIACNDNHLWRQAQIQIKRYRVFYFNRADLGDFFVDKDEHRGNEVISDSLKGGTGMLRSNHPIIPYYLKFPL